MHVDKVSHVLGIVGKGLTTGPIITNVMAFVSNGFLFTLQSAKFVAMTSGSECMIVVESCSENACIKGGKQVPEWFGNKKRFPGVVLELPFFEEGLSATDAAVELNCFAKTVCKR